MSLFTVHIFLTLFALSAGGGKQRETPGLYQGDIQLTPEQWESLQSNNSPFGSIKNRRWPNAKIPYTFESSIGENGRQAIKEAIDDYHRFTCLRFTPWNGEKNYISFFYGQGCNSPVGMWDKNRISLGEGCLTKGTALHEIGHSLGLEHEQCRPDRDRYVNIHYENIEEDWVFAFNISKNVDSLGTEYDLYSMMHYSSNSFTKVWNKKTITTKDPSKQKLLDNFGRIFGLSGTDVKQINKMYSCGEKIPSTLKPTTCTKDNDWSCQFWTNQGYCLSGDLFQRARMHEMCCKSCKDKCGKCGL
ncbi:protein SpAN isoform X1 [Hydra vulgaris]|uniref:protein SpAN isoform X1 n=1 Tax=Hydra vulgaris TaxID=6087 RepID=UPI00019273D1|nr:protein SpAN [Hydra vulgaris]